MYIINHKLKTKKYFAFTLVELIITIVILAILATIAFLSFNNYNSSARDSTRLADVNSLNKGIELYQVSAGYYPTPEGTISTGTVNGVEVVYKGIIGDNISTNIIDISKTPKDPLSNSNYVYGISYDKKYFQIGMVLESNNTAENGKYKIENILVDNNPPDSLSFVFPLNKGDLRGIENVYSASGAGNYFSKIKGNYLGIIKFSSGTTTKSYYLANIPSLLYNNIGSVDLLNTGTYYVVNNNTNLPYQITSSITNNNKTSDIIIKDVTNRTGATLTGVNITSIVNTTDSTARTSLINSTFSGSMLDNFGGNVGLVSSVVNGGVSNSSSSSNAGSCTSTTQSGYIITTLNNGQSQTFYKSITNGTGNLLTTCSNGTLTYTGETVSCNSGYHIYNGTCIQTVNSCTSVATTLNSCSSTDMRTNGGVCAQFANVTHFVCCNEHVSTGPTIHDGDGAFITSGPGGATGTFARGKNHVRGYVLECMTGFYLLPSDPNYK